jgi:pilus assembly protein Flp/PilA
MMGLPVNFFLKWEDAIRLEEEGMFMVKAISEIRTFLHSEDGATAIEYALLASLIGAATVGAQTAMGSTVINMYQNAIGTITGAMS